MQFYATAVKNHRASIELFEKLGSWGDDPESTSKKGADRDTLWHISGLAGPAVVDFAVPVRWGLTEL